MLRCDHATPLLLLYHAMPHCFRVGVSILSPLSAYSPPPHSACLHLQVAMATGCLASQSLNAQAQRQAILADGFDQPSRLHCWIYQGFVSSLLCGFFFEKKWIRLALWTCTKMSSNSEIFDKCPAWFIMMSVWYLLCYLCCCSLFTCSESVLSNISFAKCDL